MANEAAAAFVAAQKQFGPALKNANQPRGKYANLNSCLDAVMDALNAQGLALIQRPVPNEAGVAIETVFLHSSGDELNGGTVFVPAVKQDPQAYGSALTYSRRYGLMAACGIAAEDDDGQAAVKAKQEQDEAQRKEREAARLLADERKGFTDAINKLKADYPTIFTKEKLTEMAGGRSSSQLDLLDLQDLVSKMSMMVQLDGEVI